MNTILNSVLARTGQKAIYFLIASDDKIRYQVIKHLKHKIKSLTERVQAGSTVFKQTFNLSNTIAETRELSW